MNTWPRCKRCHKSTGCVHNRKPIKSVTKAHKPSSIAPPREERPPTSFAPITVKVPWVPIEVAVPLTVVRTVEAAA